MLHEKERLVYLLQQWTDGTTTSEEEQELLAIIKRDQHRELVNEHMDQLLSQHKDVATHVNWDDLYTNILDKRQYDGTPVVRRMPWMRWSAAAAVLICLALAVYWALPKKAVEVAALQTTASPENDIAAPVSSKATLTLPGGKIIELDGVDDRSLALAGAINASKSNDGLHYANDELVKVEWHTLTNPKGSKPIHLVLADGSQVWLNAASSLTYPTVFNEPERKVTVKGEGYFEIAKNADKKFLVTANETVTEVLGTHFNINAYENEPGVRITLLEGAINASKGNETARLRPGQQANFSSGRLKVLHSVDTDEVMAWKENMFEFNDTDIQSIMRQIERWYDVDVSYNNDLDLRFNGSIQRQVSVLRVLEMLEKTRGVRFKIEHKKVFVNKY